MFCEAFLKGTLNPNRFGGLASESESTFTWFTGIIPLLTPHTVLTLWGRGQSVSARIFDIKVNTSEETERKREKERDY